MFTPSNRVIGVRVTDSQRAQGSGPPNTVNKVAPFQLYGVEYNNEQGETHVTVVALIGGKVYFPPNAEEWTQALTGAREWFQNGLMEKLPKGGPAAAPTQDSVDVLGGGVGEATA